MKKRDTLLSIQMLSALLFLTNCESEEGITLDCENTKPEISILSTTKADCTGEGGAFEVTATGEGTLSYAIASGADQSTGVFENLSSGNYTVQVTDENGCTNSIVVTVGVNGSDLAAGTTVNSDSGCGSNNGEVTVTASGGGGSYEYSRNGGTFQTNDSFTGLSAGNHSFTVRDAEGCITTSSAKVLNGTSYASTIKIILEQNCAVTGCHNGANGDDKNWTVLSNVQNKASIIKTRTGNGSMPPPDSGQSLTQEEIDQIACWVDDGALNN